MTKIKDIPRVDRPREIFYPATELNAASVILIHNHPSGDATPSEKDTQIVEKIQETYFHVPQIKIIYRYFCWHWSQRIAI